MSETVRSLPDIEGIEITQSDWVFNGIEKSRISCISPTTNQALNIYFGESSEDDDGLPYYSLNWPTKVPREEVVSKIRQTGELHGAIGFLSLGPHTLKDYTYPDGLTTQQEKELEVVVNAALGESDKLDDVLAPRFSLIRVDTKTCALVWAGDGTLAHKTTGREEFGLISSEPLDTAFVMELVRDTIDLTNVTESSDVLNGFQRAFERYAYAEKA